MTYVASNEGMTAVSGEELERLRSVAELLRRVPGTDGPADEERRSLVREIAGYLLPRFEHHDAPLLVAFAGASGVGKSHVVNDLTGQAHSAEGPLRPTTQAPVFVWSEGPDQTGRDQRMRLRATAPGSASHDDESEVTTNAILADLPADLSNGAVQRLLAMADLCVVVTTPTRYADAATWGLVAERSDFGQPVWVVANRTEGPDDEIVGDLKRRLAADERTIPVLSVTEGDAASVGPLRTRLVETTGPGRTALLEGALSARVDHAMGRVRHFLEQVDEVRVRGERLKRLADTEYGMAATALAELIAESGLGAGAAAAPWPDVAERLAGVVTRRVGVAAERTALAWHNLDDGNVLLSGTGHELWRHPPDTARVAKSRLLEWERDVARIANEHAKRTLKPHRLGEVAAVVAAQALGGDQKVKWRIRRRLRDGVAPAAAEARNRLAEIAASIVRDDEQRFVDRMGPRPSAEEVERLRSIVDAHDARGGRRNRASDAAASEPPAVSGAPIDA